MDHSAHLSHFASCTTLSDSMKIMVKRRLHVELTICHLVLLRKIYFPRFYSYICTTLISHHCPLQSQGTRYDQTGIFFISVRKIWCKFLVFLVLLFFRKFFPKHIAFLSSFPNYYRPTCCCRRFSRQHTLVPQLIDVGCQYLTIEICRCINFNFKG